MGAYGHAHAYGRTPNQALDALAAEVESIWPGWTIKGDVIVGDAALPGRYMATARVERQ